MVPGSSVIPAFFWPESMLPARFCLPVCIPLALGVFLDPRLQISGMTGFVGVMDPRLQTLGTTGTGMLDPDIAAGGWPEIASILIQSSEYNTLQAHIGKVAENRHGQTAMADTGSH